jgi:hypothetical protein
MNAGGEDGGRDWDSLRFFIHFRRRFALTPCSSASLDTDTPGSRQAATRRSFDAGSYRRRPFRPTSLSRSFSSSSSITWCPPILVDTSCINALNGKRCGEIRAYGRRCFGIEDGMRANYKRSTDIGIAPLADPADPILSAGRVLSRHEAKPSRELPAGFEQGRHLSRLQRSRSR